MFKFQPNLKKRLVDLFLWHGRCVENHSLSWNGREAGWKWFIDMTLESRLLGKFHTLWVKSCLHNGFLTSEQSSSKFLWACAPAIRWNERGAGLQLTCWRSRDMHSSLSIHFGDRAAHSKTSPLRFISFILHLHYLKWYFSEYYLYVLTPTFLATSLSLSLQRFLVSPS